MESAPKHLKLAVIYVGTELGLIKELVGEKSGPLTLTELAEKSGASPDLLERILRYLSSTGFMRNVGPNQFEANKLTHVLASPLANPGVCHAFDNCGPAIQAFPSFLAETNYQDITNNTKTPFQKGFNTDLNCFQWLSQQPKQFRALQQPQTVETAFFVDVGGGYGHQCVQVREKYPNLHGCLVLQDLPQVVDKLPPIDGVKAMAHDFFEKQIIEGAKFYYLRRILHDWPDDLCAKILQNLSAAMNSESRILIDEVVLPDVNANWQAAMGDISMGILFGGKERSRKQWEALAAESGLRLAQIHTYNISQHNSIIVLELQ